jgi:hypothetical protein
VLAWNAAKADGQKSEVDMPNGRKRKRKKIATHKRKKRLRKNRHKKK